MKNLVFVFLVLTLASCLKEESPIKPYDRGGVKSGGLDINNNADYSKQIYYDIEENKIVRTIERTSWDLGFETTAGGVNVITNTSCKMMVSKTGYTEFDSVKSVTALGLNYQWDDASGNPDSLVLRDWIQSGIPTNEVFVIDRGEKPNLSSRGLKKIKIISVNSTEFVIEYANINGTDFQRKTIPKNPNKNYTSFSFEEGGKIVEVEPNQNKWDFVFTQYLATFYEFVPQVSYSVNGILINSKKCKGVKVFDKKFEEITLSDISTYSLSDSTNVIGYDWKFYDFDAATYAIVPGRNYILQNKQGFYYKLRFIDFYSSTGLKGSPRFEFVKM